MAKQKYIIRKTVFIHAPVFLTGYCHRGPCYHRNDEEVDYTMDSHHRANTGTDNHVL